MKNFFIAIGLLVMFAACQSSNKSGQQQTEAPKIVEVKLKVEGMTCDHCEMSIQKGVNELEGIEMVMADHEDSTTVVKFDESKVNLKQIEDAIVKRGYQVKGEL